MVEMIDCVKLEMRLATLMAQQEQSGFKFDLEAADRVKHELSQEFEKLKETICQRYPYYPGKVFTPKRKDKKSGYEAGCPMTKLLPFNPTCLLYTSPSPRDRQKSRMPSSA